MVKHGTQSVAWDILFWKLLMIKTSFTTFSINILQQGGKLSFCDHSATYSFLPQWIHITLFGPLWLRKHTHTLLWKLRKPKLRRKFFKGDEVITKAYAKRIKFNPISICVVNLIFAGLAKSLWHHFSVTYIQFQALRRTWTHLPSNRMNYDGSRVV